MTKVGLVFIIAFLIGFRIGAEDSLLPQMTVKTYKTTAPEKDYAISLVSPPHQSTLSTGIVTFQWAVDAEKQRQLTNKSFKGPQKVELVLHKLSTDKKVSIRTSHAYGRINCPPGEYRWQVTGVNSLIDSRWRAFKVVNLKSDYLPKQTLRQPSSLRKTRN